MRRLIAGAAVFLLLISLLGCEQFLPGAKDEVIFYYPRQEFQYQTDESVITHETRDMTGHVTDPFYLIKMYLLGPLDPKLVSSFPTQTQLISYHEEPDSVSLALSDDGGDMTDIQFTLACTCLSKTTMELRNIPQVTIQRGAQVLTMHQSDWILLDAGNAQNNGGTP